MEPYKITDDTFVVPFPLPIPGVGVLPMNTMVIRGKEPVLVDTNAPIYRKEYLDAVFKIVEPRDVKWVFISHDDRDHSGNLVEILERCPNAKIITNIVGVGRLSEEWALPMQRVHFLNNDESVDIGDRTLKAVRVPLIDSPATRGLWDSKNELLYTVDGFGGPIPELAQNVDDVPNEAFVNGLLWFNRVNHAYHDLLDLTKFDAVVDKLRAMKPKHVVSYHGAPARGDKMDTLAELIKQSIRMDPVPFPTQAMLEDMLKGPPPS